MTKKQPKNLKEMNTLSSKTKKGGIVTIIILSILFIGLGIFKLSENNKETKKIEREQLETFIHYQDISELLNDVSKFDTGKIESLNIGASKIQKDNLYDNSSISGENKAVVIYIPTQVGTLRTVYYVNNNQIKSVLIIDDNLKDWKKWDSLQENYAINRTEELSKKLNSLSSKYYN